MNLTPKENPEEFNRFLLKQLSLNLFKHKYLREYFKGVQSGEKIVYDQSVLNFSNQGWILIIHGEILLVYGENWKKSQFEEIKGVFDLNMFNNYIIQGESNLIMELVNFFDVKNYSIIKERLFYSTKKIVEFNVGNNKISEGRINDIDELSEMLQEYYHEEYDGENDKSFVEMNERMFFLIQTNKIYVIKNISGKLLGFCTIINPDIGILFVKEFYRGKNLGKILLSFCSQLILQQGNKEVFVMTDKQKIASNKVCKSVGYNIIFENIMIEINNI